MNKLLRVAVFALIACGFSVMAAPNVAHAQTATPEMTAPAATAPQTITPEATTTQPATPVKKRVAHATHKKHAVHHKKTSAKNSATSDLREAQQHLIHLGYYSGKADGKTGPKTKAGLKTFQHAYHLKTTGVLNSSTRQALRSADAHGTVKGKGNAKVATAKSVPPAQDFYTAHPDFYGHVDQQYADPLQFPHAAGSVNGSQQLPSRFAQVSVTEDASGPAKRYAVTVNGAPVLQASEQPSIIGVSKTYQVDREDAIILTTYNAGDSVCPYQHHLLVLRDGAGPQVLPIKNCTQDFKAGVAYDSLFITFMEHENQRVAGAMWRYDGGSLDKL